MNITDQQIQSAIWDHDHAGSSWAIVDRQPNEYVRVVQVSKDSIGKQLFLAWTKKLKPAQIFKNPQRPEEGATPWLLSPDLQKLLERLRSDLMAGKIKVVGSHIRST